MSTFTKPNDSIGICSSLPNSRVAIQSDQANQHGNFRSIPPSKPATFQAVGDYLFTQHSLNMPGVRDVRYMFFSLMPKIVYSETSLPARRHSSQHTHPTSNAQANSRSRHGLTLLKRAHSRNLHHTIPTGSTFVQVGRNSALSGAVVVVLTLAVLSHSCGCPPHLPP